MIKKILITALCSVAAIFGAAAYSLSANATTVEDVMAEARYWGYPESMIQDAYNYYLQSPESYHEEEFDMAIKYLRDSGKNLVTTNAQQHDKLVGTTTTTTTTASASDTSQTDNSGSVSTEPAAGNNDTPVSSSVITLTMPDGTKFDRISKDDFIKLSYDEKMAYISSFSPDQQQVIIDNLSPEERRSILKQLPVDQKVDAVKGLSDAMKTMGLNISIEEVSDDSLELSMRNESGELVSVSNAVTLVEETGYDRRKIFAAAGALFVVSAVGLYILIHQTFKRKEIGEENE
ncbi:MAG: hypothetical protein IJY19_12365 [Ruminococcus sp.]|nr:hypothetical protein [Ruminococcus sp.]